MLYAIYIYIYVYIDEIRKPWLNIDISYLPPKQLYYRQACDGHLFPRVQPNSDPSLSSDIKKQLSFSPDRSQTSAGADQHHSAVSPIPRSDSQRAAEQKYGVVCVWVDTKESGDDDQGLEEQSLNDRDYSRERDRDRDRGRETETENDTIQTASISNKTLITIFLTSLGELVTYENQSNVQDPPVLTDRESIFNDPECVVNVLEDEISCGLINATRVVVGHDSGLSLSLSLSLSLQVYIYIYGFVFISIYHIQCCVIVFTSINVV